MDALGSVFWNVVSSFIVAALTTAYGLQRVYRKRYQFWAGKWYSYHFTEYTDETTGEPKRAISEHSFVFGNYGKGRMTDHIHGRTRGPYVYSTRIERTERGFIIRSYEQNESRSEKVLIEFYRSPFERVQDDHTAPQLTYGSISSVTPNDNEFTSPIFIVREKINGSDASIEQRLFASDWPYFDSLFRGGSIDRSVNEAAKIVHCLAQDAPDDMPVEATSSEVDEIVAQQITGDQILVEKIFNVLSASNSKQAKQYWACYLHVSNCAIIEREIAERKDELLLIIQASTDAYVSVQLMRALEQKLPNALESKFLIKYYNATRRPFLARAWAFTIYKNRHQTETPDEQDFIRDLTENIGAIKREIEQGTSRLSYLACSLAGFLTHVDLKESLRVASRSKNEFTRRAARLALAQRSQKS